MKVNYQIDNIDLKILNILSKNAKMPYTEVAKKVFVYSIFYLFLIFLLILIDRFIGIYYG